MKTDQEFIREKIATFTPGTPTLSAYDPTFVPTYSTMPIAATTPPVTLGFWDSLANAFGNAAGSLAGQAITNGTAAASGAINNALPPPAPAPVAAKPFFSTPTGMILGAAAIIGGIVYLARK
jgi:hypothetical protein